MIRGMFSDMSLAGQLPLDEQDQDLSLEVHLINFQVCYMPFFSLQVDDQEVYQHYIEFYNDVYPEFEKAGKIQHFKVKSDCAHMHNFTNSLGVV